MTRRSPNKHEARLRWVVSLVPWWPFVVLTGTTRGGILDPRSPDYLGGLGPSAEVSYRTALRLMRLLWR